MRKCLRFRLSDFTKALTPACSALDKRVALRYIYVTNTWIDDKIMIGFGWLVVLICLMFIASGGVLAQQEREAIETSELIVKRWIAIDSTDPGAVLLILPVLLGAGFSEALGQSIILFANRVRPLRFLASLIISAFLFSAGFAVWVATVTLIVRVVFQQDDVASAVAVAVGASYLPLCLSFLGIIPYFGHGIVNTLYFLTFLLLVNALDVLLGLTLLEALLAASAGLILIQIMRSTVGRPVIWLEHKLRNFVAGTSLETDLNNIIALVERSLPGDSERR
jgi:hypothetical protein